MSLEGNPDIRAEIVEIFVLSSPILLSMFHAPASAIHDFTICCQACGENVPAPVETIPDCWVIAECPLCRTKRRFLPAEIFRGRLSARLAADILKKAVR